MPRRGRGAGGSPRQGICVETLKLDAPDDYDQRPVVEQTFGVMSNKPNTNCDLQSFCAAVNRGDKDSLYDATGCRWVTCETDADCDETQRCYETALEACAPHEEIACRQEEGGCSCSTTLECGVERHCVDAAELEG